MGAKPRVAPRPKRDDLIARAAQPAVELTTKMEPADETPAMRTFFGRVADTVTTIFRREPPSLPVDNSRDPTMVLSSDDLAELTVEDDD